MPFRSKELSTESLSAHIPKVSRSGNQVYKLSTLSQIAVTGGVVQNEGVDSGCLWVGLEKMVVQDEGVGSGRGLEKMVVQDEGVTLWWG